MLLILAGITSFCAGFVIGMVLAASMLDPKGCNTQLYDVIDEDLPSAQDDTSD